MDKAFKIQRSMAHKLRIFAIASRHGWNFANEREAHELKLKEDEDPDAALESALRKIRNKSSSNKSASRSKRSPDRRSSSGHKDYGREGKGRDRSRDKQRSPDRRSSERRESWKPQERSEKKSEEKKGTCYRCGDSGHFVKYCPQEKDKQQSSSR